MKSSINRRSGAGLFQFSDDDDDDDGGRRGEGVGGCFGLGGYWGGLCPVSEATGDKKKQKTSRQLKSLWSFAQGQPQGHAFRPKHFSFCS